MGGARDEDEAAGGGDGLEREAAGEERWVPEHYWWRGRWGREVVPPSRDGVVGGEGNPRGRAAVEDGVEGEERREGGCVEEAAPGLADRVEEKGWEWGQAQLREVVRQAGEEGLGLLLRRLLWCGCGLGHGGGGGAVTLVGFGGGGRPEGTLVRGWCSHAILY